MAQNTEDLDEGSKKDDNNSFEHNDSLDWHGNIVQKYDLETNHPQKLFRALLDLKSEIMIRGYGLFNYDNPKLKPSMEGVAEFKGFLQFKKTVISRSEGRTAAGIIVAIVGLVLLFLSFNPFGIFYDHGIMQVYYFYSSYILLAGIVLIVIGIVVLSRKIKTDLIIDIGMEGESYQYKGQKETIHSGLEKRERSDVVSDLRLTLSGVRLGNSKKAGEVLISDLKFFDNKLSKIVPNFRVPTI